VKASDGGVDGLNDEGRAGTGMYGLNKLGCGNKRLAAGLLACELPGSMTQ